MNLSEVLNSLILSQKLTTSELARKTGIAQPVVYRLMTGATENPQIMTLIPIAEYFGISIDQLLGIKSLNRHTIVEDKLQHDISNKIITIKTISNILIDLMPNLILGYEKAVESKMMEEIISLNILPLLQANITNLLNAANSLQKLILQTSNTTEISNE